jgi:CDP-diacylglycerol--serine O-phosphatidyltransferase
MKRIAIIPTLLTLGNAVCGFASIASASKILPADTSSAPANTYYFTLSGCFIIGAMLFDALDGYVARLSRTASPFGMELDSLCDAISFGVAPAFLLLRLGPAAAPAPWLHQALAVIAALYLVCALLRLARFNVQATAEPNGTKRFRGLPSPAAAGCLASLAILRGGLAQRWLTWTPEQIRVITEAWAPLGALAVALLMVSRLPYPHLLKQMLHGRRHFRHLVEVVLVAAFLFLFWDLALALVFWIYALVIPAYYVLVRGFRRQTRPVAATGLDDFLQH